MKKKDIVRQYLADEDLATLPVRSLARYIYKNNVAAFKDVENVRDIIRDLIGSHGDRNRSKKEFDRDVVANMNQRGFRNQMNKYNIPESDEETLEPIEITATGNYLIISDIHVPYHSIEALETCFDYAKGRNIDGVIINGDFLDFYQLSRYGKDPNKRKFADELEAGYEILSIIVSEFGNNVVYKIGNHEERYEHYMAAKAPELLGVPAFRIEELLNAESLGIQVVKDKRIIKLGKLNILHGHEFGQSVFSPVNPARGYYLRAKASVLCGHNHQTSNHTENNLEGSLVSTWSTGCLSELRPAYLPYNKWNHGFAIVEVFEDGQFEVENLKIIKGKVR